MSETEVLPNKLNVKRGLKKAALFFLIGYFAAVLGEFLLIPVLEPDRFHYGNTPSGIGYGKYTFDRFLRCLSGEWVFSHDMNPVTGIVTLFACAGWVTYAPEGKYHFTSTFLILAILSIPLWILSIFLWYICAELMVKMDFRPEWMSNETAYLIRQPYTFLSPVIIALVLSIIRIKKTEIGST